VTPICLALMAELARLFRSNLLLFKGLGKELVRYSPETPNRVGLLRQRHEFGLPKILILMRMILNRNHNPQAKITLNL
jgi:hypothetical protein